MYSQKIQNLSESATIAISTLASELKAKGRDVLSFSAGEPDFDTPQVIKDEAIRALNSGFTKYTAVAGIPELREAICKKLKKDNNLSYTPKQILVSNGAKQSLFNIFQALINDGDEVIIPAPYWVTYPELATYSGGKPVFINTDENSNFKITAKQLKEAITSKTKILVLTTPSNPTGMVYTKAELTEIAQVLKDTKIWVVSDEMYEKLLYGVSFTSVASISDDMMKRTITVNGLSKAVAMTGWRMGYLASVDDKLVKLMDNLQSQCTSNINSITQKASVVALSGDADNDIEMMRDAFEKRRDLGCELINNIAGLSVQKPQGAFYLFINIKGVSRFGGDSMKFCSELLSQEGVALVPGSAFGMEGYVRFSFACSTEQITEGIKRIEKFVRG
ncbi:pyridoxal phosphate-dependent aminotransferase [Helicobacter cappadocius]|uniref:Aminotransferase n=1 Tax=Helicobacter cappadocius TaxID=3063998 RepID=A0AA90TCG1_9HELI|nr:MULTISPECIES: pyridoxal phosphate-dependent aminotransferase [unclassified Helicobacter]MDO7253666.1 pyridoxal phosphate-dependent aminotransferase [Helicobacter sp. faydin-H75]MDP2539646.1 pyridoxal phosphate-dependent aminotransferase [Helicobacter sp. faydin-H76]